MKVINKKVYYCEFCKKHGLSAGHMSAHEKHCTLNPKRECRLCKRTKLSESFKETMNSIKKEYRKLLTFKGKDGCSPDGILGTHTDNYRKSLDSLAELGGCPMCFFSALRLSGVRGYYHFDLKEKVQEFWKERADEAMRAELY